MAKGKSSNPMDAYRKAQRAKELKKNKETRTKAREVATLKKDVGPLEAEVRKLTAAEQSRTLDSAGQARLTELRAEVVRIKKAKEEYVAAHPEHRKFVYAHEEARDQARKAANAGEGSSAGGDYDKLGRLRDPTRSVYYDPVFNPFGVPPPGMPYLEKPREEEETDEDGSSDEDDSDDDIEMPEGPPPGEYNDNASDSDDSIVMPDGTPPPEARLPSAAPVQPPPMPPFGMQQAPGYPAYPPTQFPIAMQGHFAPPMPYGQPPFQHHPYPSANGFIQAPPRNFFPGNQQHRPPHGGNFRPPPTAGLPARPMNDPLSDVPHQTFQAHRQQKLDEAVQQNQAPATAEAGKAAAPAASAVISAEPQLRDLRKEAAVFVPRVAKKKKVAAGPTITAAPVVPDAAVPRESDNNDAGPGNGPRIQSAPDSAPRAVYSPAVAAGGLMSKLSGVLGTPAVSAPKEKVDDYKTFLAGLEKLDH